MQQPQPFGYYTLINRINAGGMAEVFKSCYYQDDGEPAFAAIKKILPHLANQEEFIRMFIVEAAMAKRLQHPGIAAMIEQGQENGEYYISMEYVSGKTLLFLRKYLTKQGTTPPTGLAAYVIACVAEALDYAHKLHDEYGRHLQVIHRDISPQNIMISYEGEVKLIDFGIAKAKHQNAEQTQAGILKGKFGYMAPEQAFGKKIDHRCDIFSLGIVLHELLTNQRLFYGESDMATLELVRAALVPPPSTLNEYVSDQLDRITLKALSRDPNHRFQTAGEFAQSLRNFIEHEAPMTHQVSLKTWMYQEFSNYIAHERAQDSHFIEQMRANLQDQTNQEDDTIFSRNLTDELLNASHSYPVEDEEEEATQELSFEEFQKLMQEEDTQSSQFKEAIPQTETAPFLSSQTPQNKGQKATLLAVSAIDSPPVISHSNQSPTPSLSLPISKQSPNQPQSDLHSPIPQLMKPEEPLKKSVASSSLHTSPTPPPTAQTSPRFNQAELTSTLDQQSPPPSPPSPFSPLISSAANAYQSPTPFNSFEDPTPIPFNRTKSFSKKSLFMIIGLLVGGISLFIFQNQSHQFQFDIIPPTALTILHENGERSFQTSPFSLLLTSDENITIQRPGFKDFAYTPLSHNPSTPIKINLTPHFKPVSLRFRSKPKKAKILINNLPIQQRTPFTKKFYFPEDGIITVTFQLEGFKNFVKKVHYKEIVKWKKNRRRRGKKKRRSFSIKHTFKSKP